MTAQNRDGTPHSRVRGSEPCRGDRVRIDGHHDDDRPEDSDRWDRPPAKDQPQEEAGEDRRRDHLSSISLRAAKRDTERTGVHVADTSVGQAHTSRSTAEGRRPADRSGRIGQSVSIRLKWLSHSHLGRIVSDPGRTELPLRAPR